MFFFQGNSIQSDMANGGPKEKVILCLEGAFNPVHSRHIMAMVLGKQWLEANTNYQVIAEHVYFCLVPSFCCRTDWVVIRCKPFFVWITS
jgi:hypothetical protein